MIRICGLSGIVAWGLMVALTAPVMAAEERVLGDFWTPLAARPSQALPRSSSEQWFVLDEVAIARHLAVLPAIDSDADNSAPSLPLALPAANGELTLFEVSRSPVMAAELAAKYPEIQTFQGVAADGSALRVRFEMSPSGFGAMLFGNNGDGVRLIERIAGADGYVSYARERSLQAASFTCGYADAVPALGKAEATKSATQIPASKAIGPSLRTYRTAIAATGEYTAVFGGRVVDGLAAVVSATNRINQIYEVDLGLRLQLVANSDLIIYTNGANDPYDNASGSTMLGQNSTNLNSVIGNPNFDFGHVFSTGGGGVASAGICGSSKARGVTGSGNPRNDPFWIDYVAHEMGHQLSGPHTFNGGTGNCSGGNRSGGSAFEVGSGSTIMAYAGICGGEDLQANSDAFFHVDSLARIHSYTQTGAASTCGSVTTTGNRAPILIATPNATIPARTPFALTANASDPDGDPLTYLWDQFDLGAQTNTTTVLLDNGTGPLFRSFDATDSPTRIFPRLANILSGTPTLGEALPTSNRTLTFRVTARDNRPGGGGVQWTGTSTPAVAQTVLTVVDTGLPFRVITATAPTAWQSVQQQLIEWQVAGTDTGTINCPLVDIEFSLDRAISFPITLAAATANDGSHMIDVPDQATSSGRLRVRCANNIFFAISQADITITGGNLAPSVSLASAAVIYASNGPPILVDTAATVSDADGGNFDGGRLEVSLVNNGEFDDHLALNVQGDAVGQINVVGSDVRFGGVLIGNVSGGVGIAPLVVTFNAASTPAAAQAVLRNVTFANLRDIAGTLPRTVQARVSDGDGGHSPAVTRVITIQLNPDPFLYSIAATVSGGNVTQNSAVSYTLTFSKAIDLASVSAVDFNNAGTSSITIGAITQPQPGVLQVAITATTLGTLQLRLPATAVVLDSLGTAVPVPFTDNDTYTVIAPDTTAPQLVAFANDSTGGQVTARLAVTYLISFNEPIRIDTLQATAFSNAGSSIISVGEIALQSANVVRVRVTALNVGTLNLRLSGTGVTDVAGNALVVPLTDTATLTVLAADNRIFIGSFEGN